MGRKSSSSSSSEDSSSDSSSSSSSYSSKDLGRKKRTRKNPNDIKHCDDPWQASESSAARAATSVNQDYVDTRSCITPEASDHNGLSNLRRCKKSQSADLLICTLSSREHTTRLMENMQDVTSAEYAGDQELKPAVPENREERPMQSKTERGEGVFANKKTEEDDSARTGNQISEVESVNRRNTGSSTEESLSLKENRLAVKEHNQMVGEPALQTTEHREQSGDYESIALASKDNRSLTEELSRSQTNNATGDLKFNEEEGELRQEGIKEKSLLLDTCTSTTVKDSGDAGTTIHSSQLPVEDETSRDDVSNNVCDESNPVQFERSKSMKPKSERSAIHDKLKVSEDRKDTNVIELRSESVQSDGDERNMPTTPKALEADQIAAESDVSDIVETTKVDTRRNMMTLSGETVSSGGDAESLILRETDTNGFAQDRTTVKKQEAFTRLSAPKSLETSLKDGNETVETEETTEDSVRTWRPVEIGNLSVTNFPSSKTIFVNSSAQNGGHTLKTKVSADHDDSTMKIRTKSEVHVEVSREFGRKHAIDISLNQIEIERPNDSSIKYIYSKDKSDGLLSNAKGKIEEWGTKVEGEIHNLTLYSEAHYKSDSPEASTSKQKLEYVDIKEPSSTLDITALERLSGDGEYVDLVRVRKHISTKDVISSTTEVVEDIVKVIKQQKTHDVLCPVCGSCITQRVILRKRKRTSIASLEKWHQERIEDDSPVAESAGRTHASSSETFWGQRTDVIERGEDEDWGCLACLTLFFRRVRGVRRASTEESSVKNIAAAAHIGAESDSNQSAPVKKVELVEEASKDHVSCMPFLLPAFPWGPGQSTSETELLEPLLSRELGDSTNVDREVTMQEIVPSTTLSEDVNVRVTGLVNSSDTRDYVTFSSCLPWSRTDTKFTSVLGGEHTELSIQKEDQGCLTFVFPKYPWGIEKYSESLVADSANQDDPITISVKTELQSDQISEPIASHEGPSQEEHFEERSSPETKEPKFGDTLATQPIISKRIFEAATQKKDLKHILPEKDSNTSYSVEEPSYKGGELTELLIQKEDQGCMAFVFPEYPWGIKKYSESLVVDSANQDDPVTISVKTDLQSDQNEIVSIDRVEAQTGVGLIIPSTPEIEEEAVREVEDERLNSCLSLAFPEFPWGAGKTPDSGITAEVTEQMEENAATQVEIVSENTTNAKQVTSEPLSEGNGCFSFALPNFHRGTKKSLQMVDDSKQQEMASPTVPELQAEKSLNNIVKIEKEQAVVPETGELVVSTVNDSHGYFDRSEMLIAESGYEGNAISKPIVSCGGMSVISQEVCVEERTFPESKQQKFADVVVAEPIVSNIENFEAATQKKDLKQMHPEKDLNASYSVEEPSYKGKEIVEEIDSPDEFTEFHDPEVEDGCAVSVDTHQDLSVQENLGPSAQEELDCLSFAFPRFPWGPAVDNEVPMFQDNVGFQTEISVIKTDEGPSEILESDLTAPKITTDAAFNDFSTDKINCDWVTAVLPQFPWGSKRDELIIEPQDIVGVLTQEAKADQIEGNVQVDRRDSGEIVTRLEEGRTRCLPILFPQFPWEHGTTIIEQEEANETPPTQSASNVAPPVEQLEESTEERSLNCMPSLFPSYPWGQHSTQALPEEEAEEQTTSAIQEVASVKDVKEYLTQETRIEAKFTSTTSVVSVQTTTTPTEQTVQIQAVKLDESVTFLDASIKSNQPFDVVTTVKHGDRTVKQEPSSPTLTTRPSTGYAALDFEDTINDSLTTRPSTGYALLEALEPRPDQQINEETVSEDAIEDHIHATEYDHQADQRRVCQCFPLPLPRILWTWPLIQEHSDIEQHLIEKQQTTEDEQISTSSAELTAIVTTDPVIQPRAQYEPKSQEYLKSIVYGGLDVTLASLGVVSSAAGGEAKTITVFALALANLIAGFIALLNNVMHLYHFNRPSFEENVGKTLWINGSLTMLSFILFGSVAPVTYGFSFRSSNDRDYKFVATAIVALFCLILLGSGKARVRGQPYIATVASLIATGFVASTAGYFAGHYIKRWLQKIGFDSDEPTGAPTQAPPPFFLGEMGSYMQVSSKSSF